MRTHKFACTHVCLSGCDIKSSLPQWFFLTICTIFMGRPCWAPKVKLRPFWNMLSTKEATACNLSCGQSAKNSTALCTLRPSKAKSYWSREMVGCDRISPNPLPLDKYWEQLNLLCMEKPSLKIRFFFFMDFIPFSFSNARKWSGQVTVTRHHDKWDSDQELTGTPVPDSQEMTEQQCGLRRSFHSSRVTLETMHKASVQYMSNQSGDENPNKLSGPQRKSKTYMTKTHKMYIIHYVHACLEQKCVVIC